MAYLTEQERDTRMEAVRKLLREQKLDLALVYYDEFNIGNGWYLTGWCPQFESGAVLVHPDHHVAWRVGNLPDTPQAALRRVLRQILAR